MQRRTTTETTTVRLEQFWGKLKGVTTLPEWRNWQTHIMQIRQNGGCFSVPSGLRPSRRVGLAWLACALAAVGISPAQAATETVIHNFGTFPKGANPYGTLISGTNGTLYGTTYQGGSANVGVVFKLSTSGYQVLYSFQGGADGANPYAGVTLDSAGNLYGTTCLGGEANAGVVYKVDPSGQETVLDSFTGGADGANPYAGVILDSGGNLYGTTYKGGTAGLGVVYKVGPSSQETVLHTFTGKPDGANPYGGVIADPAGNLYGTTYVGGTGNEGVIYKLGPAGQETILYAFAGASGGIPRAGVIRDSAGNLYGTAGIDVYELDASGRYTVLATWGCATGGYADSGVVMDAAGNLYGTAGPNPACLGSPVPDGSVYKVSPLSGKTVRPTVLYRFRGAPNGKVATGPNAGVILDSEGNLYGTTPYGGTAGMVYKLSQAGHATTLYSFPGAAGGSGPGPVMIDEPTGELYGATVAGGPANVGTVYKMDAAGKETVLYSFTGGLDGAYPTSAVVRDSAGNLYGTANLGGVANEGVVYKVDPSGHETVLHSFTDGADGGLPNGVVLDP